MSRRVEPELDPLGTLRVTGPSGVGASTLPPSTASGTETGRSMTRSSPSRRKTGWGRIVSSIRASPGPAAARRALALQPQHLAVDRALGDGHVEGAAVGEGDAALGRRRSPPPGRSPAARARPMPRDGEAAAAAAGPAAPAAAEHLAEDVAEVDALELRREAARPPWPNGPPPPAKPRMVSRPSASISPASNFLRLSASPRMSKAALSPLESLLGGLVAGVVVGVVRLGQLAERLADLVRARAARRPVPDRDPAPSQLRPFEADLARSVRASRRHGGSKGYCCICHTARNAAQLSLRSLSSRARRSPGRPPARSARSR